MVTVKKFVFNPFMENSYVLYDESKECVIIDPGCYYEEEEKMIDEFNYLHKESVHFQTVIKSREIVKTSCCTKEWKVPLT